MISTRRITLPFVCFLVACAAQQPHAPQYSSLSLFLGQVRDLAGVTAKECGIVSLPSPPTPAINCAAAAQAGGTSFWFAVQLQGIDSSIWTGAARDSNGSAYRANFDSDVHGGSQSTAKPAVGIWKCSNLQFNPSDLEKPFTCENPEKVL
jgi:hypothetical protein